jgi:hypothetical protein
MSTGCAQAIQKFKYIIVYFPDMLPASTHSSREPKSFILSYCIAKEIPPPPRTLCREFFLPLIQPSKEAYGQYWEVLTPGNYPEIRNQGLKERKDKWRRYLYKYFFVLFYQYIRPPPHNPAPYMDSGAKSINRFFSKYAYVHLRQNISGLRYDRELVILFDRSLPSKSHIGGKI